MKNFPKRHFTRKDLEAYEKYRTNMGISLDEPYWVILNDGTSKNNRKTIYITYEDIYKYDIIGFDGYYPELVIKPFPELIKFTDFYNDADT